MGQGERRRIIVNEGLVALNKDKNTARGAKILSGDALKPRRSPSRETSTSGRSSLRELSNYSPVYRAPRRATLC
jgi:hypothetical protein